nr:AraC family transcriptional regulator [uncultured Blautia sp.]
MQYHLGSFGVLNINEMKGEPLVLLDGGIERRQGEIYDFHNGKRPGYGGFLFQYTLKGEGIYEREGKRFRVGEGSGFLICFPEDSRYFFEKTPDASGEFLYLHFEGSAAGVFVEKLRSICPDLIHLEAESVPVQMAVNLKERLTKGGQLEKYEGGEFLYQFLCALLRKAELPGSSQKSALADRAADYMKKSCRVLPGVGEVAGYVGVSSEHLCRCFRREFGVTPVEYLTRLKLQSAMRDLLSTGKSVEHIARDNGFSNGNYFGKVFRRYMGMSPGAYREQQRPGLNV